VACSRLNFTFYLLLGNYLETYHNCFPRKVTDLTGKLTASKKFLMSNKLKTVVRYANERHEQCTMIGIKTSDFLCTAFFEIARAYV